MGFLGKLWKGVKKVAKVAIPAAIAYVTMGTGAAVMAGLNALPGALAGKPKTSAITGMTAMPSSSDTADPSVTAEKADQEDKRKRLALNAAGASGNETTPLGVTSGATITKRKLLGL